MLKIEILPITFEIVTNECAENKVLPINFEIVTDKYVENKNLVEIGRASCRERV